MKTFDDYDLAKLVDAIDWTPFFQTWELAGRFPAILDDAKVGEAARSLYDDARKMLDRIVKEKWFTARAVIGIWPAGAEGDDVVIYADETRREKIATLHTLRQQLEKREGRFNAALSDFIAPVSSGVPDYIGGFAVTAGIGEDVIADRFKHANDDYSSILCKALADRLAEAFAEHMHMRVRREFWGYAPDETLSNEEMILEKYAGIRPAPGYPAQPDHTEKATLFTLARRREERRREADRELCDVAGLVGVGALFQPCRKLLLRRRQDRARPGRGLRRAQGHERRRDRALARADPQLHPFAGSVRRGALGERGDADGGACRDTRQRYRFKGAGLASAGLHLRGASGLAEEGREGGVASAVVPAHAGPASDINSRFFRYFGRASYVMGDRIAPTLLARGISRPFPTLPLS